MRRIARSRCASIVHHRTAPARAPGRARCLRGRRGARPRGGCAPRARAGRLCPRGRGDPLSGTRSDSEPAGAEATRPRVLARVVCRLSSRAAAPDGAALRRARRRERLRGRARSRIAAALRDRRRGQRSAVVAAGTAPSTVGRSLSRGRALGLRESLACAASASGLARRRSAASLCARTGVASLRQSGPARSAPGAPRFVQARLRHPGSIARIGARRRPRVDLRARAIERLLRSGDGGSSCWRLLSGRARGCVQARARPSQRWGPRIFSSSRGSTSRS